MIPLPRFSYIYWLIHFNWTSKCPVFLKNKFIQAVYFCCPKNNLNFMSLFSDPYYCLMKLTNNKINNNCNTNNKLVEYGTWNLLCDVTSKGNTNLKIWSLVLLLLWISKLLAFCYNYWILSKCSEDNQLSFYEYLIWCITPILYIHVMRKSSTSLPYKRSQICFCITILIIVLDA